MKGDRPAQSLQAEPSLSKKWKETGQLSPYSPNRASPRSGRRRASSVPKAPTEPLQKWKETGQLSPTGPTEPLQEVGGDGPAQSLQAQPSLSKKWEETRQLSPYSPNRTSPRRGRRRARSVLTGGAEPLQEVEGDGPAQSLQAEPSLSKKWKEAGRSVPTGGTEPLLEVEGDGPAQSLQAEPSLSQKWKETGQLSPYRRSRAYPRSGRRRASSVPTVPTEPFPEVEGDGPAQSLQAEPSLSQNLEGDGPAQSPQPQLSISKKWKETGQLSPYRRNRASPRSGRRRASSVPTAPIEPFPEVEGDGPAQSLQAEPSLSQKWKETGQLSPNCPNRAFPRSGR